MFRLHGYWTQNTLKALYVLEELGAEYEYVFVDLGSGEQREQEFKQRTPIGKVPVLEHDGQHLFESGAICRYVANVSKSSLYPDEAMQRAQVDQWLDFFSCHLGRWFTTLYFEQVLKPRVGLGEPNDASCEEAHKFLKFLLKVLDTHLSNNDWLANNKLSIADLFAFAYVEQHRSIGYSLRPYTNVVRWYDGLESRDSVVRGRERVSAPF